VAPGQAPALLSNMTNSFDATTSTALQPPSIHYCWEWKPENLSGLTLRTEDESRRDRRSIVTHHKPVIVCTPIPWSLGSKMDGYGYGQLSWHFIQGPLTFPCSNVMHITYRSTPDQCLSEDKCCTRVPECYLCSIKSAIWGSML